MRLQRSTSVAGVVFGLLACAIPGHSSAAAERASPGLPRIVVVVSAANPIDSLGLVELRRIFLRERTVWPNGWSISVFERSTDHPIRSQFSTGVLGKTPGQLAEYWLNLQLTRGLEPPKLCRTPSLLRHYLERVKGGIGYVYEDELVDGMKVVARLEPKSL